MIFKPWEAIWSHVPKSGNFMKNGAHRKPNGWNSALPLRCRAMSKRRETPYPGSIFWPCLQRRKKCLFSCMQKTGPSPTFEHRLRLFASRIILALQARVFFLFFSLTWFAIVSCVSPSGAGFSRFSAIVLSFLLALATSFQYARFDRCRISLNALRLLRVLYWFSFCLFEFLWLRWFVFYSVLDFCYFPFEFLFFVRRISSLACF